jgi:hypothetical protein
MSIRELKKIIKEKIDRSTDAKFLESMLVLLSKNEKAFIIPEHMKAGIKQGERDIANGNFFTMEEFEERYKGYLKD